MFRAACFAVFLTIAFSASAADTVPASDKKAPAQAPAPSTPKEKAEALKKKKEAEEAAKSGKKPKPPDDPPNVAAMKLARANLVYAADLCDNPTRCDRELRDDSAARFRDACRECDSVDRCDAELNAILAGNVTRNSGICAPKKK